jgi:hypothetical protein
MISSAAVRVKAGDRLVRQQYLGLLRQSARDGHALGLSARERAGPLMRQIG